MSYCMLIQVTEILKCLDKPRGLLPLDSSQQKQSPSSLGQKTIECHQGRGTVHNDTTFYMELNVT